MKLRELIDTDLPSSFDRELAIEIQQQLIYSGLLEGDADGNFGLISQTALGRFKSLFGADDLPAKLLNPPTRLTLGNDLGSKIVKYMLAKKYFVSRNSGEYNIVYLEGANADGTPNLDRPNQWNDRRMVIEVVNGTPKIIKTWEATTEPGLYYTQNPMTPKGAARIAFGQYKAWQVGYHGNSEPHEALVQVAPVRVHRDRNKDGLRSGDATDEGLFGINQHGGYDMAEVGRASAGCLVGRTRPGHQEFMALIKKDSRYRANSQYIYTTAVIPGDDLAKS